MSKEDWRAKAHARRVLGPMVAGRRNRAPGRKLEWDEAKLLKLYTDVMIEIAKAAAARPSAKPMSLSSACRRVALLLDPPLVEGGTAVKRWPGTSGPQLHNRFIEANADPAVRLMYLAEHGAEPSLTLVVGNVVHSRTWPKDFYRSLAADERATTRERTRKAMQKPSED